MENRNETTTGGTGAGASKAPKKQSGQTSAGPTSAAAGGGTSMNQGMNQGTTGQQSGEQDLLQQAKHATNEIVNQVQQRAGSQISQQKETVATELSSVVNAVRQFGQNLGGEQSGPIARYVGEYGDKAANSLERVSSYIREQDPKQLLNDVQNFGRRRPAWLVGGAFLLGFAGARLIKSSMDAAQQQSYRNVPGSTYVPNRNLSTPNVPASRPSLTPNAI
jgi:hypothetical protein